jgi:hypothetical protein
LVIFNFAAQEQTGCTFSLAKSVLPPGDYTVRELLAGGEAAGLTVDENGGFSNYVPLEAFASREGYILLLETGL